MNAQRLTSRFSVSDQIHPEDLPELAEDGVEIVVCNRPDGEAADQPAFRTISEAAAEHGMEAVHIPFTAGAMSREHIDRFAELLDSGKRVHAYCRTGKRSRTLFEAASETTRTGTENPTGNSSARPRYDVVVVGAGSGGVSLAASLLARRSKLRIALVDAAESHYYQPGWTLVGGGIFKAESTRRSMASVIPSGVDWIRHAADGFEPAASLLRLDDGSHLHYDHLVVATGLTLDWEAIEGLPETLGENGVTSNYRYDLAPYTWKLVQQLKQGKAVFSQPPMPIKCAGAPQKALYLSADYWNQQGRLDDIEVQFRNAGGVLFGVEVYVPALSEYMEKYGAKLHFNQNLTRVDGPNRKAWFTATAEDGAETLVETDFDMLHVCPPQRAPDVVRHSELADDQGWLDVDPATLRHRHVPNVWGVGDVMNTGNAKTMAAVRKQVPVLADNMVAAMDGSRLGAAYDGYGSCPLTVARGRIVLAEFCYGGKPCPTFPRWINDGTKPTRFAWELKTRVLPPLYWHGMLKGHEWLTASKAERA